MSLKTLFCFFICFMMVQTVAFAQEKAFTTFNYGVKDGLIGKVVYQCIQTRSGELWFALDGGICRYDGYDFKNFTEADGLVGHSIFRLYEDDIGRIWYISYQAGIGYIWQDNVYDFLYNDALVDHLGNRYIQNLKLDSDGNLWFRSHTYGFGKIDPNGIITPLPHKTEKMVEIVRLPIDDISWGGAIVDRNLAQGAAFSNRASPIKTMTITDDSLSIVRNFQAKGEETYFCCRIKRRYYLASVTDESFKTVRTDRVVNEVFIDSKGQFWICWLNNGITVYQTPNDFFKGASPIMTLVTEENIADVMEDHMGGIWICSLENGIHYIPNQRIHSIHLQNSLNKLASITSVGDSTLLIAQRTGEIFKMDSEKNISYMEKLDDHIQSINFEEETGSVLVNYPTNAATEQGIHLNEGNHKMSFLKLKGRDAIIRKNGAIVKVKSKGLGEVSTNGDLRNFGSIFYTSLFEDVNGDVWVGGKDGLSLFKNDTILPVPVNTVNPKMGMISVIREIDSNTLVLFCVNRGLYFLDKSATPCIKNSVPLKVTQLNDIYVSEEKDLWISTERGLVFIHLESDGTYEKRLLTERHGLASSQIKDIHLLHDTVFVATDNGLSIFPKSLIDEKAEPPIILFNAFRVNENEQTLSEVYALGYSENTVAFDFTGISYNSMENLNYAYYLKGGETKLNFSTKRHVRYPNLAPGQYEFLVKAGDENGNWSEFQSIRFTIDRPFWQKWWFILSLVIIGLTAAFTYTRWREDQIKKEERKLKSIEIDKRKLIESELKAIRAQLNPHFIFNTLNSIQSHITNLNSEKASNHITQFARLMRIILENTKKDNITLHEELEVLQLYVDIQNIRFEHPIHFRVEIDQNIDLKSIKVPALILQPLVENAILHGLAPKPKPDMKLELLLKRGHNQLLCSIEDNGIGRRRSAEIKRKSGLNEKHQMVLP